MFNATKLTIDTFVETLKESYQLTYGAQHPEYPSIIAFVGRIALENIANSDAAYHDVAHTILVTEVGQEILRGKQLSRGGVSPQDWLHFVVSLLCHDIGYVRGVCQGDGDGRYVVDETGNTIECSAGATDAAMTRHHVSRSKIFVKERFGDVPTINVETIQQNIEYTTFPVPNDGEHAGTDDYPGFVRAADLIGQLGDMDYLRKVSGLFHEFRETGAAAELGIETAADLRHTYPRFFWDGVRPYIEDALGFLQVTQDGKAWIANLYGNVFAAEHDAPGLGRPG